MKCARCGGGTDAERRERERESEWGIGDERRRGDGGIEAQWDDTCGVWMEDGVEGILMYEEHCTGMERAFKGVL